jgi:hypothetical protein
MATPSSSFLVLMATPRSSFLTLFATPSSSPLTLMDTPSSSFIALMAAPFLLLSGCHGFFIFSFLTFQPLRSWIYRSSSLHPSISSFHFFQLWPKTVPTFSDMSGINTTCYEILPLPLWLCLSLAFPHPLLWYIVNFCCYYGWFVAFLVPS